jgi:hypothetical protein
VLRFTGGRLYVGREHMPSDYIDLRTSEAPPGATLFGTDKVASYSL